MNRQEVIITQQLEQTLSQAMQHISYDRCFILTDHTTQRLCLPVVQSFSCLREADIISIPAGDINKTLQSVEHVWQELQRQGATRHSLLVSLGGGMVTDLGGFAASTFKRGIHLINIPTTLLSMVDASVGGKTGFNFGGLKNEIGVFRDAECVILDTIFLSTLDHENLLSGFAEMLKHGLISDDHHLAQLLQADINDLDTLRTLLAHSVAIKQRIVDEDPHEQGLRKALNLGHTIGHAFESLSFQTPSLQRRSQGEASPLLHGYAVAYGLVCELWLSAVKTGFPTDRLHQVSRFINDHYGRLAITCDHYPTLLELMTHDKKNTGRDINFTLLGGVGDIRINQTATEEEIKAALDFYREGQ